MLKHLKEFRLEETDKFEVGDVIKADIDKEGIHDKDDCGCSCVVQSAPLAPKEEGKEEDDGDAYGSFQHIGNDLWFH